ncbi:TetR/AcrR family transcriptional regulator [Deinococcus sp. QL22]|uniref:TetR/AcrR family transcriptional regulator n=1 Tax=Deinococcus sp. QL22 TaxID=2939437 RepID=UPI002016CE58|nr:TetR/AcrR family transcriptional regulator [Deinococcus sp. QL22]UQN08699.1 TetR/AcrR family transcriptional regulator [Deinococcus sp. QL22]
MTTDAVSLPQERILQAALKLLEAGGVEAVSTRAVSAAADVQPPTIYRHFGDMQGLLDAVAVAGFTAYLQVKGARASLSDPVEELRAGWNLHLEFGLTHPHLYTAMHRTPELSAASPAALEGAAMLRSLMQRVAEVGRLGVSVDRAAAMFHAACKGVTLSLLGSTEQDHGLSEQMREAVLKAVLVPEVDSEPTSGSSSSARQQAAAHAVSLVALLPSVPSPLSEAEQALLIEWLGRLT